MREVEPRPARESLFRNKNVRLYCYMTTVMLAIWSFSFGATFDAYLLELAKSQGRSDPNSFVGVIETIRGSVALVLALPLGYIADKVNRRRMLQVGSIIATVGLATLSAGIAYDSVPLIYTGTVVAALFMQVFQSCGNAFLSDCVPRERLTEAMTMQGSLFLVGYSVGPLAQVVLVKILGDTWRLPELHAILVGGFAAWPLVLPAFFMLERSPSEVTSDLRAGLAAAAGGGPAAPVAEEEAWKSERVCGVRKKWFVPGLIEFCSLITAIGAGMTVKFFPLFFKEDYGFEPIALNALSCCYTLSIAVFVQLCRKVSTKCGRCQAALIWNVAGISCLFALWRMKPLPWVILLYIVRGSFMNAVGPLNSSIVLDCVDSKYRGRWSAVQSISRFSWSGSAVLGGLIADNHGYRYTFFITGLMYTVGSLFYVPLLGIVPAQPTTAPAPPADAPKPEAEAGPQCAQETPTSTADGDSSS